jgi:hypothetical protein
MFYKKLINKTIKIISVIINIIKYITKAKSIKFDSIK